MAMTGGGGKGMTTDERDAFLRSGALFAKIGTTNAEGWPMVSPVWYLWDGHAFLVVGKERTSYIQNLRRDPRCGVLVDSAGLPYKRVSVLGEAEFLPESFDWQAPAREMVLRYIGPDGMSYAEATFGFPRVPILIHPRWITTWDGGGFDRTFHRETVWHEFGTGGGQGAR